MKKLLSAVVTLFCLAGAALFAWSVFSGLSEQQELQEQYEEELYVAFSSQPFSDAEEVDLIPYDQIEDYESPFSALFAKVYYQSLSETDQRIYHALTYALSHGKVSVFFDDRLLQEQERSFREILDFLSLDSPLVEQNLKLTTMTLSVPLTGDGTSSVTVSGRAMVVESFSEDALSYKMEALDVARQWVAELPAEATAMEKAEHFYKKLTQEVSYRLYEEGETPRYLYDAFLSQRAQCDGFANSFSLLCNLAGIPAFEKMYKAEEEGEAGHTWNSFCIDGIWYNADCALSDSAVQDEREYDYCARFAFSDALQSGEPAYASLLPACDHDVTPPVLLSETSAEGLRQLADAFEGNRYLLVGTGAEEWGEDFVRDLANRLQKSLHLTGFQWDGRYYYFVFKI